MKRLKTTAGILLGILSGLLPHLTVNASTPLRLWSPGKYRQQGRVEVTGRPGKDYYVQVGPWTYWYKNGRKREEGTFTEGTKTGEWTYWYDNGIRRRQGAYNERGEKQGRWDYWHRDGLAWKGGEYRDDRKDGHWIYHYHKLGWTKEREGSYRDDREDGFWVFWYEDGRKKKEGSFREGLEEGPWTFWYEDGGKKCEGSFRAGLEIGEWTYWDRDEEGGKLIEWTYDYGAAEPAVEKREFADPAPALVGHWTSRKVLSNFQRSDELPEDPCHVYFRPDGSFLLVREDRLVEAFYTVEETDPDKRSIQVRITSEDGRGLVLFGLFSPGYNQVAGRYYRVDFLLGARGGLDSYFILTYVGDDTGPALPDLAGP